MTRDSQRSAVYRWGWTLYRAYPALDEVLTKDEILALVRRIFREYGKRAPTVIFANGDHRAWAKGNAFWNRITLPVAHEWARKRGIVLHEAAHCLTDDKHGPRYARMFLDLMVRYAGVPAAKARSIGVHQKPRRVRFAKANEVRQRKSAAWIRWHDKLLGLQAAVQEHKKREPA